MDVIGRRSQEPTGGLGPRYRERCLRMAYLCAEADRKSTKRPASCHRCGPGCFASPFRIELAGVVERLNGTLRNYIAEATERPETPSDGEALWTRLRANLAHPIP
jgi:hypothetical protein